MMRVLLVQNLAYIPTYGGANKANRVLIEGLAARGHLCRVVAASTPEPDPDAHTRMLQQLAARGISPTASSSTDIVFQHRGVEVHTLSSVRQLHAELQYQAIKFEPTWILLSSEDPGQQLLERALEVSPSRVVSTIQTTLALPFGPASFLQSPSKAELFRRTAGVITICRYMQDYLHRWGGIESDIIPFPVYGPGPFPHFGNFERGSVTMINPSGLKGISIFLSLARQLPGVQFAAVETWGTTAADRRSMEQLPNVRLLQPVDEIDEILAQTRILLVPSLWGEAFGYVVVEAMLRGIPVLASNVGGVPEAKLGVDYVLPVNPITRYEERFDDRRLPVPVIPQQDTGPWRQALQRLLSDRAHYERLSAESREAATAYVSQLGIAPFEKYLENLTPAVQTSSRAAPAAHAAESLKPDNTSGRVEALSPERRALLAMLLKEKRTQVVQERIARRQATDPLWLSFAQQRLWFLHQLEPQSALYNLPAAVRLTGPLKVSALVSSINEIIRRHEVLRTTFSGLESEPVQVIRPQLELSLKTLNLSEWPESEKKARLHELMLEEARQPFDLSQGPLLRATLLQLAQDEHIILLTMHHIVSDGWSIGVLIREIAALYEAFSNRRPAPLADLPIQYADFAVWQRKRLTGEVLEKQLAYWRQQLGGQLSNLELPTDRLRPAAPSYHGAKLVVALPASLVDALKALSQQQGSTLFMTMLAVFKTLLYRYTGQVDITVGTPIAGRNYTETETLIGCFINTLVLRTDLSGDVAFDELLSRVKKMALEAYAHQDLPFEKLVEELRPTRSLSHTPFFHVMFALHNVPMPVMELAGIALQALPVENGTAKFDVMLSLEEIDGKLLCAWVYKTELFEPATIERMASHYQSLLGGIVANPAARLSALPLLTDAEREQLLIEWNNTAVHSPRVGGLHELFEAQVERTPEAIALVCAEQQLTYAELNAKANQVARYLRGLSVRPEALVGIMMERSPEMLIGLLGVLKAGCAYVPLDAAYPRERIGFMMADARLGVLLTQERLLHALPAHEARVVCLDSEWAMIGQESVENPDAGVKPEQLAYVIYTSGSTGQPKAVLVEHRSVINLRIALEQAIYSHHPAPLRVSLNAPLTFDASVKQWIQLLSGHTLCLVPEAVRRESAALLSYLTQHEIAVFDCTPLQLRQLLAEAGAETALPEVVLVGGEAIDEALWTQLGQQDKTSYYNVYGPTECTVDTAICRVAEGQRPVIGQPVANAQTYILDEHQQPVPVGVAGELYIGGHGLARGYLNQPGLTALRFIPHPLGNHAGMRLYRTGDVACYLPDGNIEYLGRNDRQVKIFGFRIELGEIEAALCKHEQVRECALIAYPEGGRHKRLIAFIVAEMKEPAVTASQLRSHLKQHLPEHMIPASFIILDALPLTPNGKLDRRLLEAMADDNFAQAHDSEVMFDATPVEEMLAQIWAEVLGVELVSGRDNFFELGGHSLLGTRMISRVRAVLSVEAPLRLLFESATLAELAAGIEQLIREQQGLSLPPITRFANDAEPPLSFTQRRLWFLSQVEPDSPSYNIASAVRLKGLLHVTALEQAFSEIVRRHEALRTIFPVSDGRPRQHVLPAEPVSLSIRDLTAMPASEREAELRRLLLAEAQRPFDLAQGPLLRTSLLCLAEDEHLLSLTMHHIISDGWSMGVLVREVAQLYEAYMDGQSSPLPELPIQYVDFAAWEQEWLQGSALDGQLAYWKKQLAGVSPLQLPVDRTRPAMQTYRGARHTLELSGTLSEALKSLSRRENSTLFMTLLAAFQALLRRYTYQDDIAVGTPIAGRGYAETEQLIGCFVNTLVMRTEVSGDLTFLELLGRVRETALGAYAHQDVPFEALVEQLHPERSLSYPPLFQVMFSLQNAVMPTLEMRGLNLSLLEVDTATAKFDLTLNLLQEPHRVGGFIEYNTDLFDAGTIARLSDQFLTLLEGIVAAPDTELSALPLLSETELHRLLVESNQTKIDYPQQQCIHQLFERQAVRTPEAIAVSFEGEQVTYHELDRKANQLAHYLRRLGVAAEVLVGICVERSTELLIGLLGILKAGGAYLPLDMMYPKERLAFMLKDAGVSVLLTQEPLRQSLPEFSGVVVCLDTESEAIAQEQEHPPITDTISTNLAYVIYTSGSTGRPKGVPVTHTAVVNFLTAMSRQPGMTGEDILLSVTTISFDIAGLELFLPLSVGARVIISSRLESLHGASLVERIASSGITVMQATPSTWRLLIQAGWQGDARLKILCGGELLPAELAGQLLERCAALWNLYGPTETTIWSSAHRVEPTDESILIGRPIANTQIYLLDEKLQPVPTGVPGELYIGGAGLARGYLKRPALTAEKFIPHPFSDEPGGRLYRTGDLARYRSHGMIEYLGRIDNQVKLRGYRIELGEIDTVLERHPAVLQSAVMVREDRDGDQRLVAYLTIEQAPPPTASDLRRYLSEQLPSNMVPTSYIILEAMPLTPNGKLDRRALYALEPAGMEQPASSEPPQTPAEKVLAGIFCEVLELEQIGLDDNFFELGGHSLLATRLLSQVREVFRVEPPLRGFLEKPTIRNSIDLLAQTWDSREIVEEIAVTYLELAEMPEQQMEIWLEDERRLANQPVPDIE